MMKSILKQVLPQRVRGFMRDSVQMIQYATPNPLFRLESMSENARNWSDQLRTQGIAKIEGNPAFLAVAEYVEQSYFKWLEANPECFKEKQLVSPWGDPARFIQDSNKESYGPAGVEVSASISFRDPGLSPLLLSEDVISAVGAYYKRQPYFRNQPLIQKVSNKTGEILGNGRMHVDHLHQVSLMLLVSDVTEQDTHMEYCIGSNNRNLLAEGVEIPLDNCGKFAAQYPIFPCVGKRGTLFIFDTIGFHRASYLKNSTRKMLHCNITTGHHLGKFEESKSGWADLESKPDFVKRMFRFLK